MAREDRSWQGLLYTSEIITVNDATGSGWIDVTGVDGPASGVSRAWIKMVPSGTTSTQTVTPKLNCAFNADGDGEDLLHTFTAITSTDAEEDLIIPGGDSEDILIVATDLTPAPIPKFWKFNWTVTNSPDATVLNIYAAIVFG